MVKETQRCLQTLNFVAQEKKCSLEDAEPDLALTLKYVSLSNSPTDEICFNNPVIAF